MKVSASIALGQAANVVWDVVIVGAGPAGAMSAYKLARLGRRVLLIDKSSFPRAKVCGSCLSGSALGALKAAGLGQLPDRLGARPLGQLLLSSHHRSAFVGLPDGVALSRECFDAALVQEAITAGSDFLPETLAFSSNVQGTNRSLEVRQFDKAEQIKARIIIAAEGLAGRLTRENVPVTVRNSRIGAGAIAAAAPSFFEAGVIYMACGKGGYVGLVRLEDGRLDLAAALVPELLRSAGNLAAAVSLILAQTGWPIIDSLPYLPWRGTPLLTQHRTRLGHERLFIIGDAAGYIEPFTGEGIGWALNSALALAPIASAAVANWRPEYVAQWTAENRRLLGNRQRSCRLIARALRSPTLTRLLIEALSRLPVLARPFIAHLNRQPAIA